MNKTCAHSSVADHESDCSSYSYCPDFKNYIDQTLQQLFYVRVGRESKVSENNNPHEHENLFRSEYKRMSLRRDRGILSKITGTKKKSVWKILNKNKYEHPDGVLKELRIGSASKGGLDKTKKQKIHQRLKGMNLFEIIFDASLVLGPDKKFLLASISEDSVFERDLLVGDFIKSIDGEIITPENINNVLRRILDQKRFKIVAYESYKDEFDSSQEEIKITKPLDVLLNKGKLFHMEAEPNELVFSLNLIVQNEQVNDNSDDFATVFSYPPKGNNFLHKLKGSFLTISSILKTSFGPPKLSIIQVHDNNFYVTYSVRNDNQFIFIGFNSKYAKPFDVPLHSSNLLKFFDYIYPDIMTVSNYQHLTIICEMMKIQLLKQSSETINFEQLFTCSNLVPLPKEIVLRINDSLSELEAMDYRNWNESLMELFGKFNVSGSCLFYKTSLICTHFSDIEMKSVELFLRQICFKLLYQNCFVREIAMWQRVYPKEYQSYNTENDSEKNKVFLLVAAHGNLMMCVMLEENGFNLKSDVETQSSNYLIYFLEEMNDILNHLRVVGIENLTRIWINSAKRPQCSSFMDTEKDNTQDHHVESFGLKSLKEEDEMSDFDSQKSSSIFDMNEFSDAIYKDFTDIIPQTITFGYDKNALYHFTQIDLNEGICITSLNSNYFNGRNSILVDIFRKACIKIHKMLQKTIKFNLMFSKENSKILHKSILMPTKEKGLLVQLKTDNVEKSFWIVGRLFGTRELFVCYDAAIPQNIVEIAFRIGLNCIG